MKKRSEAPWLFETVLKDKPNGVDVEKTQIDENTIVLNIRHPPDLDTHQVERLRKWASHLRKTLPSNVFLLVSDKRLGVEFDRPPVLRSVSLILSNCKIQGDERVWKELGKELNRLKELEYASDINIRLESCDLSFNDELPLKKEIKEVKGNSSWYLDTGTVPTNTDDREYDDSIGRPIDATLGIPTPPESALDKMEREEGGNDE